ncbi:TMEM70 family protein [Megaselia abdita]
MLSQRICKVSLTATRSNTFRQGCIAPALIRFASTTDGQEKIYTGSLASRMKAVKLFSLTTSITGAAVQPTLLEQSMKVGGTAMAIAACGVAGFFTIVTPLLLHFVTKKYVTELYFNKKTGEYTAITISLVLTRQETTFKPEDVTVPEVPGMFTSFEVNNKSLFLEPSLFPDPEHYVKIMGYDKPVDFKLNLTEAQDPQKSKK